ncbi:PBECR2 nuclease fold domain-containing protein [Helicobacter equorum]|uniref:putative barnase/colicin E5 family endoribonuclease n=1 Tax=Helicobacter equorum TaxID=361872 RepID=UPI001C6958B1|nr:PBECR2 nuclease fold domain-containing protein [Helicobacter equorum]
MQEKKAQTPKMAQKATNEAQLFGNSEQLQVKTKDPTAKEAKNITFIDPKGKEREITKQVQEQWLKTFNLKSLDEDFIPQFSDEVRQALNKAGITQDFHLKLGSLIKLDNKQREAFLPYIKPTIEYPDLILDDGKGILFIKEFVDSDKNRYFMSVAKDFNDEWIFSSHTRRELKDIQKKTDNSRIIYNNGFKGGEVAGASDILESGGTTTKPSDLQITYPANHSSGKNPKANSTTKNTNPTQNTSMIHTKEAIKQYLQGFSKHLSNQSKQQIPSVLKEIDSFTNANDIVQYTGAFKKEIQQFIPYLETKEKLEQVLQTPKLQRDPKENLEVSITRIDEKPSKIHLAFDEKGYIPYDTHIAEEFLKQPTTNKDTSTLIDTFIKGAYKKAQKDLSDTYLLDLTGSKIDFGEDITLLNGRELYYKDKQINNEYASPSVLINTAKKLKEGLSDSDLYLAHANKDNLANYHYPYNLLNEYLEDISLLSDWGLADLLVDKSIKQSFNQALDKAFKANGEPFGVLWNNEATKKNLEQNLADYGISINPKDFFVGKNAIDFLLDKQSGYIQSAFHKEGLGDIDLVWGDSNFGLKHILQERTKQWGEEKALRFISHLSENIQKGHIVEVEKGRIGIKTELTTIILDKKDGNNFVITAFRDSGNKKELESLNLIQSKALTSENAGTNAKESPITSLNQDEIIPQTTQEIIKQAKASGKSVAETKELLQKHKEKDSIQDNPQVSALQTKIQQTRQQIAESKNPDKEYLHQVFKPDEIIQLEKQYFNQAMPQEYKELIQDFPSLYEQSLANKLKTYVKDTDTIQEVTTNLLNDFKDKPFKDTAKHAELLLFNTLKDKAQELGFKELDINEPSFKVAFGKFQARLKKGDIQDLSEHIAINSLRKNRLRIQEELNINPIKEFGTNYAEHYHSGESAIAKLLAERQGQVAGAFYRKELGDIDLVWGDSKMGLAHILERRTDDFIKQGLSKEEAQTKARELIGQIPEILEQSTIYRQNDSKIELITSRHTLVLGLRDDRKFIITELIDKRNKKRLGSSQTGVADTLTDETLTNKSLSSSQHLDTSTTPADPHQSGFADSNFSTSLKSEAKNDFNPTTKDLIQQSKYLSKIMDLNKKNNKGTLDKKNKLIQEFKQKEPQIYQAMVRKEVYRHYHNKGLYLDDHIVDPDDFLDQYNYIYKREQARQNQNHKHHIETKLEQYKEELENILNNLDSIKNPITQLKKLNLKIAKLPIKQAFGDPVHKDAVLSLSDTIDTALSDIFAKLPQYTENKKQILQESKTKTQEFITYMQEVRGDIDYMLDANPKAIKPYMQERLKEAKPYEKKFLERIQDQVKQIEEKNKDSAPNLGTKVPTTKNTTSQTKEQSFQAQKPLTQKQIQQTLEARKQELIKASKDLELESKSLEKETLKVAPILAELNKEWKELNPFMIKWKERKKLYGNFGQVVGQEKRLSKRKPNLKNLEHIKETLSAYKIYANNGEQQAKQVEKEIALLESYVKRLEDKPNIQELREKTQIQEQALSNERRMINSYNDLREVFNRGAYTDKHILETSNLPKEKQEEIKEFIAQTREYLENTFAITPIKEFGTNYAEFCKDGKGAIQKLLAERQGQVAGAFHKEGLGDIDLVWGDSKMGLQKIITKHIDDFNDFAGETQQAKLANGLSEIVENGKVVSENGVNTIWYKRGDDYYLVGLSKGFNGIGENEWIITSYEKRDLTANQKADINSKIQDSDTKALSPVSEFNELQSLNSTIDSNPTTKDLIKEAKEQSLSVKETKEAMQDLTQATQDLTHLKQKLENASDEEKGEIIKETITEQNNKLLEEITKLQNVLEKKDFLPFEIDEKIKWLSTKSQFIGEDEESLKKVAISQLEFETKDKIKELQKVLKDNKIGLGTLKEFLTKAKDPKIIENKTAYESVKATLKRLIEKNQKRVLKILDNAIQERKLTYYLNTKDGEERGRKLFYSFKPDTEQIELFEKIFPIAQKLGVEVKQAINNEFLSKEADGVYYTQGNSVRVKNNRMYQEKGKVFLHELIHSVTSRAMIAYESGKRELLSPNQIVAINNIQKLYKEVHKNHKELGFETFESFFTGHKGDYGLKNSHEFIAELSNPIFREKLKKVGVFEKLVDNILRLFVSAKEALGLAKTNAYESLKKNLYEIIDNYKEDFTNSYEKESIKGVNLEQSKELESRFLNSTGELNIEALKNEATKLPKVLSFREFKEQFRTDTKGNAKVNTLIGEIKINVPKAYNHFVKNTYNVDRKEFSGAFLDTLVNPLFIVRQKYRPKVSLQGKSLQRSNNSLDSKMQNKSRIQIGDKEIIQDSYVFYKPFVNENGLVSLASFAISQNGELLHKTFYDIKTLSKLFL